jgi:integrase
MLLRRAARAKWLEAGDPLGEIKPLAEPDADVDPLAPSEITAFVAAAPAWWRPFFVTAFWTGARPGELAALRWPDVDAHARRFGIRARLYRGELGAPKTKASSRDVDMLPPVVDALRQQRAQQAQQRLRGGVGVPDAEHDFVFTGPDGGTLNLNYLRERIWAPTFRRAGLRARSFYQTRHSFASNALAAGEDPTWIARTLGHKTVELLFSTYTKWVPTRTRRDGSALLAHFQAGQKPGYDTGDLRAVESGGPDRATDSVS